MKKVIGYFLMLLAIVDASAFYGLVYFPSPLSDKPETYIHFVLSLTIGILWFLSIIWLINKAMKFIGLFN